MSPVAGGANGAVVFDMDGVLLEGAATDPDVYRAAALDALGEFGVEDPPESVAAALGDPPHSERMDEACAALGIDRDAWWTARERLSSRRANERIRAGERRLFEDAAVLEELVGRVPLGLATNNRQATATFVADWAFEGVFDAVVGREPTVEGYRRRKPEPDLLNEAMARLDADGGLYVGDRGSDVLAADRAGLEGVFLERPHNDASELAVEPAHVLGSLRELPSLLDRLG